MRTPSACRRARSRIRRSCQYCSSRPRASTGATRRCGRYVNPGAGRVPQFRGDADQRQACEHVPAQQAAFRQLYLNEWRDGAAEPWLDLSIWDEGEQPIGLDDIDPGTRCWLGVDLSSTQDLTAVVAVLEHGDGYLVLPRFFVPAGRHQEALRARRRAVRLLGRSGLPRRNAGHCGRLRCSRDLHRRAGRAVPGRGDRDRPVELDGDHHPACMEQGLPVIALRAGFRVACPCLQGARAAGARPAAAAHRLPCAALVPGQRRARAGRRRQHQDRPKSKAKEKVDGAVALAMAISVAQTEGSRMVYEERPSFLMV